ncbi:MAG: DUF2975 domain-containing protein [Candidatus Aminicenantes bacterium]
MKNKKNDPFFFIFKTITNIVFYLGAVLGVILVAVLIALSVFPEHFQGKISLPVNLDISDVNMTDLQVDPIDNLGIENKTTFQITYLTKDLFIVRVVLVYFFIIMVGVLIALFFWKKILTAYQKSTFFSKENRTMLNYLGWLLIVYFPLLCLMNLFFEALINLQLGEVSVSPSLCQGLDIGILLVVLGSVMIFMGKIVND